MDASCETNPPDPQHRSELSETLALRPNAESPWVLGVDISETEGNITGVGRYTLELLKAWLDSEADGKAMAEETDVATPQLILFARNRSKVPPELLKTRATIVATSETQECTLGVVRWQQTQLPRLLRRHAMNAQPVDLLFCPAYAVPLLSRTPSVVALHDLSFERDPKSFSRKEGFRRRTLARAAARRARGIITISEFSRAEIEDVYNVSSSRIAMVYPGCDRTIFCPAPGTANQAGAQTNTPFLLSVGTLLQRRNISNLIRAFAALGPRFNQHRLVIIGSNQTRPQIDFHQEAESAGVADRVQFQSHVSEADLVDFYRTTDLLISLSEYEGFGLPVLEGLCCGAPTLLLATDVYRELWANVVPMVDSCSPETVASAIENAAGVAPDADSIDAHAQNRFNQEVGAVRVLRFLRNMAANSA